MKIPGYILTKLVLCFCVIAQLSLECSARRKDRLQKPGGMPGKNDISGSRRRHPEVRNSPEEFPLNGLAEDDDEDDEEYDANGHEDSINLSTNNEEVGKGRRRKIDPKGSWFTFVKYSEDRTGEKGSVRRKKKRNRKHRSQTLHGPPGPVGPPGPPGPPGISFTKEEILAELQTLIQDEAEKKAREIVASMRDREVNKTLIAVSDDMTSQLLSLPRIYAGFTMRLKARETIGRKSLKELKFFQQPFGPGAFTRGDTFNTAEGRFVVPRDGIYHFTANLRVKVRAKKKLKSDRRREHAEVSICIDSKCNTNTSISTINGINKHQTLFTVTITGTLHLQEKQYTSVYVDNASSFNIIILAGSEYSGLFLGV